MSTTSPQVLTPAQVESPTRFGDADAVGAPPVSISAAAAGTQTSQTQVDAKGVPQISLQMAPPSKIFGFDPKQIAFGNLPGQIQLEQTEILDQLARYLNHLHEHRRINEGDDTSDAPGYAMNLVRIPISVLPGSATKHGYGAEITITAEPYLGPELLPTAFRDLVVNDLVDQLAPALTRFVNNDPKQFRQHQELFAQRERLRQKIAAINASLQSQTEFFRDPKYNAHVRENLKGALTFFTATGRPTGVLVTDANLDQYVVDYKEVLKAGLPQDPTIQKDLLDRKLSQLQIGADDPAPLYQYLSPEDRVTAQTDQGRQFVMARLLTDQPELAIQQDAIVGMAPIQLIQGLSQELLSDLARQVSVPSLPASTTRKSTLPFPPSHLADNYGLHELGHVFVEAYDALQNDVLNREVIHITDVEALLREEIGAAYELLRTDAMRPWWDHAATNPRLLYDAIRLRNQPDVDRMREDFLNGIGPYTRHHKSTASLAWCIYVESLLLNERLLQDMKETFGNQPNSPLLPEWLPFFGPDPCPEARDAFSQYVRVRWPIHVFHVDPVVTEQNIADIRSVYRQMQMAVALAFSQQKIGLSCAMQAMRMLQRDRATFDLNRTVVGFGHGDDTFGWKFYPRFQTPPVESNFVAFFRDTLVGGPTDKHLECSKEIEPGTRECMAIVLMPSFVPHVTFSTRSNWFRLNCASRTGSSVHDTVHYGRVVKQMQTNAMQCGQCAHLYRDGEIDRLLKRVHQLDRKLAMQTLECQVPIENTHGGFEIFSAGTRELAPELTGWYGAPGYDPTRPVRLFLSGDNFSVTTCRLIAGNQEIPIRLLSRQIMEVTLPAGLPIIRDPKLAEAGVELYEGYIDAHVATPYGVSGHLLIPAVRTNPLSFGRITLAPQIVRVAATAAKQANGTYAVSFDGPPDPKTLVHVNVPREFSSGGLVEKIALVINSGAERLIGAEVSVNLDPGTTAYRFVDETNTNFAAGAAAPTMGASIKPFVERSVNNSATKREVFQFDVTAMLKRGDGATAVLLPIDGSMIVEVKVKFVETAPTN